MATSALTKVHQFSEDLAKGVHQFGTHQLKVALCAAANAPTASNSVLADLTQIAYTNCSAREVTTTSCEQTTGTTKLILADLTLTASGGSIAAFRYVVLYNDSPTSPADPLIGFYDYGADLTLASGESLLIDFDGPNGALTVA